MRKYLLLFFFFNILLGAVETEKDTLNFQGFIKKVIEKENSSDRNNIYLELISSQDSSSYYIDDFYLVFIIEQTHKFLLSDYIGEKFTPEIQIKLENITVNTKNLKDSKANYISSMEKIFPDYPNSDASYLYSEINPGNPEENYYHRYIEVPISYQNPQKGTFKLYYELCSDFDKSKPTIIIPTDGQRSLSQVGWADKYKQRFNLKYNTVTYEYRGMYASDIPDINNKALEWETAYEILNSDNVIQDIERIRKDLLGDEKVFILGGSGTAMIGLKYVAQYPEKIKRAFLMSFFKDAQGSSESGVKYFKNFINENNLNEKYIYALENPKTRPVQLRFLLQRLLYFDKEKAKELIVELSEDKFDLYRKYTTMLGDVDFFTRSIQKYKPWSVVFMYETNINTTSYGIYDINHPFYEVANPIRKAFDQEHKSKQHLFNINNLENVNTEILLVGGKLDQVAPLNQLKIIHKELPNSKLAVFDAYHCLQSSDKSKEIRNKLANLFFENGYDSEKIKKYLNSAPAKEKFIKIIE